MIDIYTALAPLKENPEITGIFSDLDGTLSDIATTPAEATISPEMRDILKRLSGAYTVVAIVSGRDSNNAKDLVRLDDLIYIGNHGLEWLDGAEQFYEYDALDFTGLARDLAHASNRGLPENGVFVEKKKLGIAFHYRRATDKETAKRLIEQTVRPLIERYPLRRLDGRYVIELKPNLAANKGDAVTGVVLAKDLENVLYLGDDVTDLDAFRALDTLKKEHGRTTVSVVVSSEETANLENEADYTLRSIAEVESLLGWLAEV